VEDERARGARGRAGARARTRMDVDDARDAGGEHFNVHALSSFIRRAQRSLVGVRETMRKVSRARVSFRLWIKMLTARSFVAFAVWHGEGIHVPGPDHGVRAER